MRHQYDEETLSNNGIYRIINIINNKTYIGSTAQEGGFKRRLIQHISKLKNGNHNNRYLQNAWNKHGEGNFSFEIVEICSKDECLNREQYYLDNLDFKIAYNICRTAGSTLGYRHTPESKVKISETGKGRKLSEEHKLKLFSKECIEKRSNALKGRKLTKEHSKKIGLSNKGKEITKETRKKISKGVKDHPLFKEQKLKRVLVSNNVCKYILISPEKKTYSCYNLKLFCKAFGLTQGNMCKVIAGKNNCSHHKKWTGKREPLTEEEINQLKENPELYDQYWQI